ncbi:MAG: radical SAM/SPASM domain-containing protein [Victivallales bacterium]
MLDVIFLELTNHCNMDCSFCPNHLMTRPRGFISPVLARRVIDQLRDMEFKGTLITSLMGEPLLHPNFKEILQYALKSKLKTDVITNITLIPERIPISELLNLGINRLCMSYQTPDEKTYQLRHSQIPFKIFHSKLMDIVSYATNNPVNTNQIEIHILHSFYNYLNVDIVNDHALLKEAISGIINDMPHSKNNDSNEKLMERARICLDAFFCGNQYLDTFRIPLTSNISIIMKRANTWSNNLLPSDCSAIPSASGHCAFFSTSLGILWDGRVTVCCQDFDARVILGDVKKNTVMEISKGDKLTQMQAMEKKGLLINKYCQLCKGKIQKRGESFEIIKAQPLVNRAHTLINRIKVKLKRG